MTSSCVQVKAAEKYRDSTDASSDVKARARYTNGKGCLECPLVLSCLLIKGLLCTLHPAVLLLYISERHVCSGSSSSQSKGSPAGDFFKWTDEAGPFDAAYDYT